jgi:hypothetical protein
MKGLAQKFQRLTPTQKRIVHRRLCEHALGKWSEYIQQIGGIQYTDSVVGTHQEVDIKLPSDALRSAQFGSDLAGIEARYREPIVAMQDIDLEFPAEIEFAYYSIYNLFRRYALNEAIDDWLIVNQALSAEKMVEKWVAILQDAIDFGIVQSAK